MFLWASETPSAPRYMHEACGTLSFILELIIQGLQSLCKVNWDPRRLPHTALSKKYNPLGKPYYRVDIQVVIHFLTTLEFKIMSEEEMIGTAVVDYV
jgi:hypothetical protein